MRLLLPVLYDMSSVISNHVVCLELNHTISHAATGDFVGCTFEVAAYTTDRSSLPLQLWVEDEEYERRLGAPEPTITPIKSAKLGADIVQIQLYAEC